MSPADGHRRPEARLAHIDVVRTALVAAVIVAHAAMTYGAAGTWIYEEDSLSKPVAAVLGAVVGGGVLFGLGLFFLIAGLLSAQPLRRAGPGRFLRGRLVRLGLPVLAYALVVWPALHWVIGIVTGEGPRSPLASYRAQLGGRAWQRLGTGPMWFVAVLLGVTALWCLWRGFRPAPAPASDPKRAAGAVWTAAGVVAVATFAVRVWFPIDSAQFLDLHLWLWPQALALFALGAAGAEAGWIRAVPVPLRRQLRRALGAAIIGLVVLIVASDGPEPFKGGWHWQAAGFAAVEGVWSVGLSLLLLDLARRHVRPRPDRPLLRRLADASYGAFVAQGPVLVAVALALRAAPLPGDADFVVLAVSGVVLSFGFGLALRPREQSGGIRSARPGAGLTNS